MRKLINYKLLFLSPFFLAACSNEDNIPSILPSNQPDAVELGITAGVTLTKSVINSGTQANASKDDVMKSVAVYARLKLSLRNISEPTRLLRLSDAVFLFKKTYKDLRSHELGRKHDMTIQIAYKNHRGKIDVYTMRIR